MTNLDSIFKSRDITLPTKVRLVKAMVFPVVMYGCESWTMKKAERRKIDAFELWCWTRLLSGFQTNIYFCFIGYAKAFDCVDHIKLGEILQETGISDHLTCFLRHL